ncbi:hypothetical protein JCM1841_003811 [Sporobolomyces salmonicolor]
MARHQTATGPAPAQEKQKTTAELRREREVVLIKWCIAVTSVYVLVEIVIDYQFNALFLIADSFHMLNDIVAFAVQLYADEVGALKREHGKDDTGFSYGFGRTQFVTNLINGVLLLALCLMLALESMQRFYSPETKTIPPLVASMGFLGLVWNVFMFFQFMHSQLGSGEAHLLAHPSMYRRRLAKHNTQAGNLAVIVDGLLSVALRLKIGAVSGRLTSWNGIGYVDLLASLVVVCVILVHSFPLVMASSYALMQAFDTDQMKQFQLNLLCSADLHIWSLSKDDRVATVKFLIRLHRSHSAPSVADFLLIQNAAKHVFEDADRVEGSVGK